MEKGQKPTSDYIRLGLGLGLGIELGPRPGIRLGLSACTN